MFSLPRMIKVRGFLFSVLAWRMTFVYTPQCFVTNALENGFGFP